MTKPIPLATRCSCCGRRFTIDGDSKHRMSGPDVDGNLAAWCRACDPWADAAAKRPLIRPGVDPCTHVVGARNASSVRDD